MKVLHLTKTLRGGAGVAAMRSVSALRQSSIDVALWTEGASSALGPASGTIRRWLLDRLDSVPTRLRWRRRRFATWSNNWIPTRLSHALNAAKPDIVHLHWIGQGFFSLYDLAAVRAPIIWTMHDAWSFTGGCHYPDGCLRYQQGCGCCPQLGSGKALDLSSKNMVAKRAILGRVSRWISPSAWLAQRAADSGLVPLDRIRVIPYALDAEQWAPVGRHVSRRALGLPDDALVLVAGAMYLREPRKGCHLVHGAVERIAAQVSQPVILLLFGHGRFDHQGSHSYRTRHLGRLKTEEEAVRIYSAADVFLMPSLQDNLPCVVMEAQACGCPTVGFYSGGISEIVQHGRTGMLSTQISSVGLAEATLEWLFSAVPRDEIVKFCRERQTTLYAPASHASALLREYEQVLAESSRAW